jgi:hypothetical protein
MKTSELTGAALDWAVAKCERVDDYILYESFMTRWGDDEGDTYQYSTDWAQGGPIIEREEITLEHLYGAGDAGADVWVATLTCEDKKFGGVECFEEQGPTPLIAAMRCYVASKLGDTVDIPEELK